MSSNVAAFIKLVKHPVKFRVFLFMKLPSAYFSGVRVREIDERHSKVSVPFKWFSQNPFRSTYFACLSMAAEMSTGILAMAFTYKASPAVSMLVVKTEAEYFKKATGVTTFICNDGLAIKETIDNAIASGEGKTFVAESIGVSETNEMIARFRITWSFKVKRN